MKVLTREDLMLILQKSDKPSYDEREIIQLFDAFGEDYFIEGNEFKPFGSNYHMSRLRESATVKKPCLALIRIEQQVMLERYFLKNNISFDTYLDFVAPDRLRYTFMATDDELKEVQTFLDIIKGEVS